MKEKRTIRKTFRFRLKNIDIGKQVERKHLMTERLFSSLESTGDGISPNQKGGGSLHRYKICSVVRLIKRDKSKTTQGGRALSGNQGKIFTPSIFINDVNPEHFKRNSDINHNLPQISIETHDFGLEDMKDLKQNLIDHEKKTILSTIIPNYQSKSDHLQNPSNCSRFQVRNLLNQNYHALNSQDIPNRLHDDQCPKNDLRCAQEHSSKVSQKVASFCREAVRPCCKPENISAADETQNKGPNFQELNSAQLKREAQISQELPIQSSLKDSLIKSGNLNQMVIMPVSQRILYPSSLQPQPHSNSNSGNANGIQLHNIIGQDTRVQLPSISQLSYLSEAAMPPQFSNDLITQIQKGQGYTSNINDKRAEYTNNRYNNHQVDSTSDHTKEEACLKQAIYSAPEKNTSQLTQGYNQQVEIGKFNEGSFRLQQNSNQDSQQLYLKQPKSLIQQFPTTTSCQDNLQRTGLATPQNYQPAHIQSKYDLFAQQINQSNASPNEAQKIIFGYGIGKDQVPIRADEDQSSRLKLYIPSQIIQESLKNSGYLSNEQPNATHTIKNQKNFGSAQICGQSEWISILPYYQAHQPQIFEPSFFHNTPNQVISEKGNIVSMYENHAQSRFFNPRPTSQLNLPMHNQNPLYEPTSLPQIQSYHTSSNF
ncbi:hypothetical protein FGO68_gene8578 [Halteria grandinella]|uniref:Uncharacterized protein n=1 Tax=Halteria grandinella TaxID=5974 RepID=A0A8J8NYG1_HALGN|nr:hypothetical protein FGO68_gene8578 [Halteria grandinella]